MDSYTIGRIPMHNRNNSSPRYLSKINENKPSRKFCTRKAVEALFIIAPNWK